MNVSAAAGATPPEANRAAIGTDAHSQPGNATPASPAAGTATSGWRGSALASQLGGTSAVIAPLTSTPRTRNGNAWIVIDTKIVDQVRSAAPDRAPASRPRLPNATTISNSSSLPSNRGRRRRSASAGSCHPAGRSGPEGDNAGGVSGGDRHASARRTDPSGRKIRPRCSSTGPIH
jgi:hypothetical protein